MTLGHGPKIITNGLVFAYDMHWNDRWVSKSYKGKPTVNYAWSQNPRIDSSYSTYSYTASGTWAQKHYDAIRVYNKAGTDISAYVNTGVTDYTNTYHATWVYDSELKRPVVVMRNFDGTWKAKHFNLGKTFTDMGLTNGDTYTISWLQWTDNITRSARAGLYGQNSSGTNGFHDGQSHSYSTSFNTKPNTWQRVYATFTVAATNSTTTTRSCYMYGHYVTGVLKIADLQIEAGGPSGYIAENSEANSTRSNTGVVLDWTGNNTVEVNNLTYNSDGTFSFPASNSYMRFPENSAFNVQNPTIECWVKTNALTQNGFWFEKGTVNSQYSFFQEGSNIQWRTHNGSGIVTLSLSSSNISTSNYSQVVATIEGGYKKIYVNGVLKTSAAWASTIPTNANGCSIGAYGGYSGSRSYYYNGNIGAMRVYNRALTAAEIKSNFEALRGRYGI